MLGVHTTGQLLDHHENLEILKDQTPRLGIQTEVNDSSEETGL
jgi:hypothetical protein